MKLVPETHLVGTLEVGTRERLGDEEVLELRPPEGIPAVGPETPRDDAEIVVGADHGDVYGLA